jgi:hypothetical protein
VFCEHKASADRCGQLCSACGKATLLLLLIGLVYVGIIVLSRSGPSCGGAVACSLQQSAHCGSGCSVTPFSLSTWILSVAACCVLCELSVYFVCGLLIIFGLTLYSLFELFHLFYVSFNCFPSCAFLACQRRPAVEQACHCPRVSLWPSV